MADENNNQQEAAKQSQDFFNKIRESFDKHDLQINELAGHYPDKNIENLKAKLFGLRENLNDAEAKQDLNAANLIASKGIKELQALFDELDPTKQSVRKPPPTGGSQINIYKDPGQDPDIKRVQNSIIEKADSDPKVIEAKKTGVNVEETTKTAVAQARAKAWSQFIKDNPEKAEIYKTQYEPVRQALEVKEKAEEEERIKKGKQPKPKTEREIKEENPTYRAFMNDSATGVNARIWQEHQRRFEAKNKMPPPENTEALEEYQQKAGKMNYWEYRQLEKEIRPQMEKEFLERRNTTQTGQTIRNPEEPEEEEEEEEEKKEEENREFRRTREKKDVKKTEERQPSSERFEEIDRWEEEPITEEEIPAQKTPRMEEAGKNTTEAPRPGHTTEKRFNIPRPRKGMVSKINRGGRNLARTGRAAGRLAGMAARMAAQAAARAAAAAAANPYVIAAIIIIIIIIFIILIIVKFISFFGVGGGGTGPTPTPTGTAQSPTDISACGFYRGDQTPQAAPYQSSTLLSYFSTAGTTTGVAAAILAGVARIESPSSSYWTSDNDLNIYQQNCVASTPGYVSSTGALGIMQIQPAGGMSNCPDGTTTGCVDEAGILWGAQYAGLPYASADQLTKSDYCNLRTSIFLGAGVILDKMVYNGYITAPAGSLPRGDPIWTTNREYTDAIARSYYGCLLYPSCTSGPYSYGNDLWNSVSNCKTNTLTTILQWGQQINTALQQGLYNYWNKMVAIITNGVYTAVTRTGQQDDTSSNGLYFCTNLVIDSYNLAGKTGLGATQQGVINMVSFWKNTPGYFVLDYTTGTPSTVLTQIKQGYTFFQEEVKDTMTGSEHVNIITQVNINSSGDGYFTTIDADATQKTYSFTVSGWNIVSPFYTGWLGFGGIN